MVSPGIVTFYALSIIKEMCEYVNKGIIWYYKTNFGLDQKSPDIFSILDITAGYQLRQYCKDNFH